jgi:predicted PurR-regulated permease PerM
VTLVFVLITVRLAIALLVLVPMLWDQVMHLIDSLPRIAAWVTGAAVPVAGSAFPHLDRALRRRQLPARAAAKPLEGSRGNRRGGPRAPRRVRDWPLFALVANVALVPVLTFYFLRDWDVMVAQIRDLLPRPTCRPFRAWRASRTRCSAVSCAGSSA